MGLPFSSLVHSISLLLFLSDQLFNQFVHWCWYIQEISPGDNFQVWWFKCLQNNYKMLTSSFGMHNIDSPWFRAGQDLIKGINNIKFQIIKTFETIMKYSSRYQLVNIKSIFADLVTENRTPIKLWAMSCVPFLSSSIGIKYNPDCWTSLVSPYK